MRFVVFVTMYITCINNNTGELSGVHTITHTANGYLIALYPNYMKSMHCTS